MRLSVNYLYGLIIKIQVGVQMASFPEIKFVLYEIFPNVIVGLIQDYLHEISYFGYDNRSINGGRFIHRLSWSEGRQMFGPLLLQWCDHNAPMDRIILTGVTDIPPPFPPPRLGKGFIPCSGNLCRETPRHRYYVTWEGWVDSRNDCDAEYYNLRWDGKFVIPLCKRHLLLIQSLIHHRVNKHVVINKHL